MNTAKALRSAIGSIPEGEVFVPRQFLTLSPRTSIDQSLTRLTRSGEVVRLARGLYVRPKINKYVGPVTPEPGAIATSVAKAHGAKIQVTGAEAARRLELTTQVPTQPVYYTTGPSRQINVGRLRITLKRASPRRFALEGLAGLALSALRHMGRAHVTPEIIAQVKQKLPPEEFEALRTAATVMPAWLSEALNRDSRLRA
jgi:Family of unknown function (DUF6088)